MKLSEASKLWLEYHRAHSKENSIRAYTALLGLLDEEFHNADLEEMSNDKMLSFINRITEGKKTTTKRTRYSHLLAFFNFIKNNIDPDFRNPCDTPPLKSTGERGPEMSSINMFWQKRPSKQLFRAALFSSFEQFGRLQQNSG
jgi:hypothetical protein